MIAVLPYSSGSEYLDISWLSGNVCAGQLDCGHRVAVDRFRAHRRPRRRRLGRCSSGSALSNFRFPRRLPHRYRRQKTHVGYLWHHLRSSVAGVVFVALKSSLVLIITAACSFLAALLTTFLRLAKRELTEEEKQAAAADNALNLQALKSWDRLSVPHPFGCLAFSFYAIGMMISGAGIAKVGTSRRRLVWAVAIGVEAIGFAMMAALGVSRFVVIGCGIAGLAGGMLSPLQMVLMTLSIYQLAVLLVAAYMLVAVWVMIRGLKVLPSFVASEATTTPVDTISGQSSPEGETSS